MVAFAFVLIHGMWLERRERRASTLLARIRPDLSSILLSSHPRNEACASLTGLPWRLQIQVFADLSEKLGGASRQRLYELARQVGLASRAERWCRSRLWWRRLRGVRLMTLLGGGESVIEPLFEDRRAEVRAQAAEWAADHPDPRIVGRLLVMLDDPQTLCRFTVKDSLLRIGKAAARPLERHLSSPSGRAVELGLEVAAGFADPIFLRTAVALCGDRSPRIRSLAATVAGALGGPEAVAVLDGLLGDEVAEVRASATIALGKLGHWPSAPKLAGLLRDEAWEVRRQAGLALRSLGSPGELLLRAYLRDADRFAADMARHVLEIPSRKIGEAVSS